MNYGAGVNEDNPGLKRKEAFFKVISWRNTLFVAVGLSNGICIRGHSLIM